MRPSPRPTVALALFVLWLGTAAVVAAEQAVPMPDLAAAESRVAATVLAARAAVEGAPQRAIAWGHYGMVLDAHRFAAEAAAAYEQAHALDPQELRWPYFLALVLDLSQPERAVPWFEAALQIDPSYVPARIRFGETLEKLGRMDEAQEQFRRAADIDPESPFAAFGLGRMALAKGAVGEAIEHLERAYSLAPRLQAIVVTLARAYHRAGREEEAQRKSREARGLPRVAHHPDNLKAEVGRLAVDRESYLRRARTFLDLNRAMEAAGEVKALLDADADDAEALLLLAEVRDRQGDAAASLAAAERALAVDGEVAGGRALLASLLFKAGRFAQAESRAREVLDRQPEDVHMLLLLAMTAARRGEADAMLARLDEAIALGTEDPELRRLLVQLLVDVADSYAEIEQYGEAVRRLEQAVSLLEAAGSPPEELALPRQRLERYRSRR